MNLELSLQKYSTEIFFFLNIFGFLNHKPSKNCELIFPSQLRNRLAVHSLFQKIVHNLKNR